MNLTIHVLSILLALILNSLCLVVTDRNAPLNDWGAICYADGQFNEAIMRPNLEIYDRVGGGDSFASGLIYGLMEGKTPLEAVNCGAAHGCTCHDHSWRYNDGHSKRS